MKKKINPQFDYSLDIEGIKRKLNLKKLIKKLDKKDEISFEDFEYHNVDYHKLAVYVIVCECCMDYWLNQNGDYHLEDILYEAGLNKEGEHDKLLSEEIEESCVNGKFLPLVSKNFRLVKENNYYADKHEKDFYYGEYWSFQIIESKENNTFYYLQYHSSDAKKSFQHYSIKKKFKNKETALNFLKKEHSIISYKNKTS